MSSCLLTFNDNEMQERILLEQNATLYKKVKYLVGYVCCFDVPSLNQIRVSCTFLQHKEPPQPTNWKKVGPCDQATQDSEVETELYIGRPERGSTLFLLQG